MLKLTNKDFVDFNYHEIGKVIRCTYINGEPWFVAIDACKILEYKQPKSIVRDMIDKSKTMTIMGPTKEGSNYVGKMTLITYGALNKLVLNSRMPKDMFSAFEYGLWRIKELEEEYIKTRTKRSKNRKNLICFTQGKF